MHKCTIKLAFVFLVLGFYSSLAAFSGQPSKTYQDTRKLLSAMEDRRSNSDELAALFKVGGERIDDLTRALDDPDHDISLRAQIMIRYLGNAEGMKALNEWYIKQRDEYRVAGPIPLPLSDWDYKVVNMNFLGKPPQTWRDQGVQYIYALALDGSQQARTELDEMIKSAGEVDETTFVGYAIKRVQTSQPKKLLTGEKDLAKLVLDNAFFLSPQDHKRAAARLLGLNGVKDKALVEVHINRGQFAEEWYHVVISRCGQGWKFFAIAPIAVS